MVKLHIYTVLLLSGVREIKKGLHELIYIELEIIYYVLHLYFRNTCFSWLYSISCKVSWHPVKVNIKFSFRDRFFDFVFLKKTLQIHKKILHLNYVKNLNISSPKKPPVLRESLYILVRWGNRLRKEKRII